MTEMPAASIKKSAIRLAALFAVIIQIQVTLFASDNYLGLRVNLADIFAPMACLFALFLTIKGHASLPAWIFRHIYIWLGGLFLLLLATFANGYMIFETVSRWAVVNKLGGWVVLCSLMMLGGWIATNGGTDAVRRFLIVFISTFIVVMGVQIVFLIAQSFPPLRPWTGYNDPIRYPIAGLMANRNAYALLFTGVLAMITCLHFAGSRIIHPALTLTFYASIPFFIVFNGSRASFLACGFTLLATFLVNIKRPRLWVPLLLALTGGAIVFAGLFHDKPEEISFLNARLYSTAGGLQDAQSLEHYKVDDSIANPGDTMRVQILNDALEMAAARPVFGSGLGSALLYQKDKHGEDINIIDNTPLWILTEMGLIGILAFGAFFILLVTALYRSFRNATGFERAFQAGLLTTLAGFSIMCLFHEILYTRHLWMLIGMGLCVAGAPRTHRGE